MDRVSATKASRIDQRAPSDRDVGRLPTAIAESLPLDSDASSEDDFGSANRVPEFHLRQTRRQLELISDAANAFSIELDFQRLLAEIARQSCEILRADQVIVYSNIDSQLKAEVQIPASNVGCSPAVGQPQDGVEENLTMNADATWCVRYLKSKVSSHPTDPNVRNSICVPLVSTQNRVLGVIEARNKRTGGDFSEQDARTATCLARVAASAVDRARLFGRIEEWKQSIETLLSFNATVNQHLEPEKMVRELVANVTGFLDAAGGAAGIVIQAEGGAVTQSDGFYFDGRWHDYEGCWRPGEGIPGVVLETEFPLLINDYKDNVLADPALRDFGIGSCICVPIKNAHEEVLGFFKLHRRIGDREFTWQDAAFLESLGNTAAVAIENAQLVKSLELKNAQIKSLSQDHVRRLEEERQHIARELHDETGQVLIGLKLRLQVLGGLLNEEQAAAKDELAGLRAQLNDATVQLRELAKRLRPPTLDELGFEAALRQLVSEYRNQKGLAVRVDFQATPSMPCEFETAFFRIAQEGLTNIVKHASADTVEIAFAKHETRQVFSIRDNGCGFDPGATTSGLGLMGMRERVKMLGGTIQIDSAADEGTAIEISFAPVELQCKPMQ